MPITRRTIAALIAWVILPMAAVADSGKPGLPVQKTQDHPRINGPSIYGARPNHPFLYRIPATGKRPMQFSASGLPPGLKLDSATGIITGAVKTPGASSVVFRAQNAMGTAEHKFRIVIGDTIALTPPMGWSSWYFLQCGSSDQNIQEQTDAMVSSGLADHGYSYINIDGCWTMKPGSKDPLLSGEPRDASGTLRPNRHFKDMKALTDYIHAKGLKAGIYSSPGPVDCAGYATSWGHEEADATTFARWGFDFLKYDLCSYGEVAPLKTLEDKQQPYRLMGGLLQKQDRDIVFNLCQYGGARVWEWGREVGGHFWRESGDLGWGPKGIYTIWDNIVGTFEQGDRAKWAGPGGWNDPDNIEIGYIAYVASQAKEAPAKASRIVPVPLTPDEQYTYMSLWSLLAAPLILSSDLTQLDNFALSLLTNDEVIDVNQDSLGKQATRVFNSGGLSVWAKDLEDGSKAVGLFNLGDTEKDVAATWADLGISGKCAVRDLWRQEDLGRFDREFQAHVTPHGVVLVRISAAGE
jgi:alpha-galactosidase